MISLSVCELSSGCVTSALCFLLRSQGLQGANGGASSEYAQMLHNRLGDFGGGAPGDDGQDDLDDLF